MTSEEDKMFDEVRPMRREKTGPDPAPEMVEALTGWVRDALFSFGGSDELVLGVDVAPTEIGQDEWSVRTRTCDRDGGLHSYRVVVNPGGEVVEEGEEVTANSSEGISTVGTVHRDSGEKR